MKPPELITFTCIFLLALIKLTSTSAAVPEAVKFLGDGYNFLKGNPDGDFWSTGGDDPGFLLGRKVLTLTTSNKTAIPPEVTYEHHDTCHEAHSLSLVYDPKTYQNKLLQHMQTSGSADTSLRQAAFTLSTGYAAIKRQIKQHHYVYQDQQSRCMIGKAIYRLSLAQEFGYSVTDDFAADVCALPAAYNETLYMQFLDKWGTHIVTEMEIGWTQTKRNVVELRDYIKYIQQSAPHDLHIGGAYPGADSSYQVKLRSWKYRSQYSHIMGKLQDTLTTGNASLPEPIGMTLATIDLALSPAYWNRASITDGNSNQICPQDILEGRLTLLKANMVTALNNYAAYKHAVSPNSTTLAMPVTWPRGTYGLPKPTSGCPAGDPKWLEGWRHQYMEGQHTGSVFSSHWPTTNHFSATLKITDYLRHFCIKAQADGDFELDWPAGDYCILKSHNCPQGFKDGYVKWDDDDTRNHNRAVGTLPDGIYDKDTLMHYCCRGDGYTANAIILPTDKPFYLYQYQHGCQTVHGMKATVEYLVFDDEDDNAHHGTHAAISSVHPGMYFSNPPKVIGSIGGTISKIYYCYYQKKHASVPSIIG